jgi:tRNA modification GTPase
MREGLQRIVSGDETIVAISTPLGRSGVGVVRLSGAAALSITRKNFKPNSARSTLEHRQATVGAWEWPAGECLDEVVVTFFQAPQSYTGEDVVEISGHGNPLILGRILESACSAGARLATPGEFTLRAVAHGKMDLIQAEAVREFIDAQTGQQARTALRQMEGALSRRIRPVKDHLVDVIAHLEAGIDFAEDDVDVPENSSIVADIAPLAQALQNLQETFSYGKMLVEGVRVAILGKPNVGKSSLFNRLLASERAIVTDIPGTTRDVLSETVSLEGVPLRFSDTAGVREALDRVESIGVSRTFETLADADLALVVLDGSEKLDQDDRRVMAKAEAVRHVVIINKKDLPQVLDVGSLNGAPKVHLSATTGEGLDELWSAIRNFLGNQQTDLSDDSVLTNARQNEAILKSIAAMHKACEALAKKVPHEMVLLDLYQALAALDELTGEVVTDDILDRIFSTFCIGK